MLGSKFSCVVLHKHVRKQFVKVTASLGHYWERYLQKTKIRLNQAKKILKHLFLVKDLFFLQAKNELSPYFFEKVAGCLCVCVYRIEECLPGLSAQINHPMFKRKGLQTGFKNGGKRTFKRNEIFKLLPGSLRRTETRWT